MNSVKLGRLLRPSEATNRPDLDVLSVYREHGVILKSSRDDNFNKTPENLERYLVVRRGDLVVNKMKAWSGSVGVSAHEGIVSGDYLVCSVNDDIDSKYLHHVLRSPWFIGEMRARSKGIRPSQERLYWEDLAQITIPVPSVEEQRRIADFLDDQVSRIDGAVDSHAEQLKLMAQRRESALEFIVLGRHHRDVVNASWRPFQSRPASWREGQLRSVRCDVQTGPFGSQLHAEEYVDNGWPVVNPANIGPDELIAIPECSVDENTRERLGRHVLKLGDVVFGRRGELGRAGLVTREQVGWVCGTGSLRVRLLDDQLSPDYLLRLLRTSALRYYFDTQAVGSTMANLNTGILMAMPLLLPQADEQVRIVANAREVETAHDEIERLIRSQVLLLTERKRALITAAVTGEFDVTTATGRGVA